MGTGEGQVRRLYGQVVVDGGQVIGGKVVDGQVKGGKVVDGQVIGFKVVDCQVTGGIVGGQVKGCNGSQKGFSVLLVTLSVVFLPISVRPIYMYKKIGKTILKWQQRSRRSIRSVETLFDVLANFKTGKGI